MLVEIFYALELYARFKIDYSAKAIEIIEAPNREIRFIDSCFLSTEGFRFDFDTVRIFLKNRNVNENTKTGVYYNVDSNTKIVVIRPERI